MKKYYTAEDVARWQPTFEKSVTIHLEKLSRPGQPSEHYDFHLGMLSLHYCDFGMMRIAQGRFEEARKMFQESVQTRCKMFERAGEGVGESIDAGQFQSLLIAFVTKDESLVARMADLYKAEEGVPESIYLGSAVKLLAKKDTRGAKAALAQKKPRFETLFVGYDDCLEAIADKNEQGFASGLKVASESWRKVAARRYKGLPSAVCFIQGAGLVLLAESVLGKRLAVVNEYIPPELLQ
jgi:hypothetical protein